MNISCTICVNNLFTEGGPIYSTLCGHIFHHHCILQWLKTSSTCPNCRQNVKTDNLLRLNVDGEMEGPPITPFANNITRRILNSNRTSNFLKSKLELRVEELSLKNDQLEQMEENYKAAEKENDALRLENDKLQKEVERLKNQLQSERERNTIIRSDLRIIDIIDLEQARNETIDLTPF